MNNSQAAHIYLMLTSVSPVTIYNSSLMYPKSNSIWSRSLWCFYDTELGGRIYLKIQQMRTLLVPESCSVREAAAFTLAVLRQWLEDRMSRTPDRIPTTDATSRILVP